MKTKLKSFLLSSVCLIALINFSNAQVAQGPGALPIGEGNWIKDFAECAVNAATKEECVTCVTNVYTRERKRLLSERQNCDCSVSPTFNCSNCVNAVDIAACNDCYIAWTQQLQKLASDYLLALTACNSLPGTPVDTETSSVAYKIALEESGLAKEKIVKIEMYPNPATDALFVKIEVIESELVTIEIINTLGERVKSIINNYETGSHKQVLDLTNLSSGVYFVRVYNSQNDFNHLEKIVISGK